MKRGPNTVGRTDQPAFGEACRNLGSTDDVKGGEKSGAL